MVPCGGCGGWAMGSVGCVRNQGLEISNLSELIKTLSCSLERRPYNQTDVHEE